MQLEWHNKITERESLVSEFADKTWIVTGPKLLHRMLTIYPIIISKKPLPKTL